jgi:hypothetical protein
MLGFLEQSWKEHGLYGSHENMLGLLNQLSKYDA